MVVSVSVVIPCFRCSESLYVAIESIDCQFVRPMEVIVVDDASDDGGRLQLQQLQNEYGADWLRLLFLDVNQGPGTARNLGWEMAEGEYVAFLDADDRWLPEKIALQYQWMSAHPELDLCGHSWCLDSEGGCALPETGLTEMEAVPISHVRMLLGNPFSTPCVMLKRSLPYRFEAGGAYSEDYELWARMVFSGVVCARLPVALTVLGKPAFGAGGLSAQLWKMEKGELGVFLRLLRSGKIHLGVFVLSASWSLLKFLRRYGLVLGGVKRERA
jgi:glycosyltransferase involved in cell wall biosynthesis